MIATAIRPNGTQHETLERLAALEEKYFEARKDRDAKQTYLAGETDRLNPVPQGIDPLGAGADSHYRTERNYFLMVEHGRHAVRNHPLVEQGINRLIANLKLGEFQLDVDSGDPEVDKDQKDDWRGWTCETAGGRNECDYEGTRSFAQIACQSFFSQIQEGITSDRRSLTDLGIAPPAQSVGPSFWFVVRRDRAHRETDKYGRLSATSTSAPSMSTANARRGNGLALQEVQLGTSTR
jgi:hypothetical protein